MSQRSEDKPRESKWELPPAEAIEELAAFCGWTPDGPRSPESHLKEAVEYFARSGSAQRPSGPTPKPLAWFRIENGMRVYYETPAWPSMTPLFEHPPSAPSSTAPTGKLQEQLCKRRDEMLTAGDKETADLLDRANFALASSAREQTPSIVPIVKRFRDQRDEIWLAALDLLRHCDNKPEGETAFEKAVIVLRAECDKVPTYAQRLDNIFKGLAEAEADFGAPTDDKANG